MKLRDWFAAAITLGALAFCGPGAWAQVSGYSGIMSRYSGIIGGYPGVLGGYPGVLGGGIRFVNLGTLPFMEFYNGSPVDSAYYGASYVQPYDTGFCSGYDAALVDQSTGNAPIVRTNDAIDVRVGNENNVRLRWEGDTSVVRSITFDLLDASRKPLKERVVTQLPAEARLTRTENTAYYKVVVAYLNGTTTSVISPL